MNCPLGYLRSLEKHTLVPRALERQCHARTTDDGGRRTRRRGAQRKCGGFREAGQALVDSALSGFVEHSAILSASSEEVRTRTHRAMLSRFVAEIAGSDAIPATG